MSRRARAASLSINDPGHHLTGPFLPQTPLDAPTPRSLSQISPTVKVWASRPVSPWLRWTVQPRSSLKLLLTAVALYINWELTAPYLPPGSTNPFAACFLLAGHVPESNPNDPRYAKSYRDLLFIAYHVVFFSLVRQVIVVKICRPVAKWFGLRRETKFDRFGEQGYAWIYFAVMGTWGYVSFKLIMSIFSMFNVLFKRIMSQHPTYWYQTKYFWIDYPHWDMKPELKRYYLVHMAYWLQQLLVLILGLEKPRKDYNELVAHHIVTLWLVGWSYFMNMTLIGNAVYMSMDIPDTFFAFSKLLNYIQWNKAKVYSFVLFIFVWSYFRHYLNFRILWSVWYELWLMPDSSKIWDAARGVYFVWWMQYQVFVPILLLQFLNLYWYYLIMRVLYRSITTNVTEDSRSDDESDDEEDSKDSRKDD